MWLGFRHRSSFTRSRMPLAAAMTIGIVATIGMPFSRSSSDAAVETAIGCVRVSGNVVRYCGPSSARLSVFAGAVFSHGFCARKRLDGIDLLQVRIGAKSLDGSRTNDGLPYFSLGIAGARSRPKSGNVIAYYRSKRWIGRIVSFKGDPRGGTLVTRGVAGSRGRATARFCC